MTMTSNRALQATLSTQGLEIALCILLAVLALVPAILGGTLRAYGHTGYHDALSIWFMATVAVMLSHAFHVFMDMAWPAS